MLDEISKPPGQRQRLLVTVFAADQAEIAGTGAFPALSRPALATAGVLVTGGNSEPWKATMWTAHRAEGSGTEAVCALPPDQSELLSTTWLPQSSTQVLSQRSCAGTC